MTDKKKIYKQKKLYFIIFVTLGLLAVITKKTFIPEDNSRYKDFNEILKRGTLVIAVQDSPLSMQITGNDTLGFAYQIIRDFATQHNLRIKIKQKNSIEEEIKTLKFGGCNIIADLIPHTEETKNKIAMSVPIISGYAVIVQNKSSKKLITRHTQLAKREIKIPKDSPYKSRISNMEKEVQDSIFINEARDMNIRDIIEEMKDNSGIITICDNHQAEALKKEFPFITTMQAGFMQDFSIGMDKNTTDLADTINSWLTEYMKTERFIQIKEQYTGTRQ